MKFEKKTDRRGQKQTFMSNVFLNKLLIFPQKPIGVIKMQYFYK